VSKQKYFVNDWLEDKEFKSWLRKDKEKTNAKCCLCHKTISLSTAGRSALTEHASGKKHKEIVA